MARSLGIPAICGISQRALALPDGSKVVMDASQSILNIQPNQQDIDNALLEKTRLEERLKEDKATAHKPAYTLDHVKIEVVANVRNEKDAIEAMAQGAEGIGLLRTDFLFSDRQIAPDEAAQKREYCALDNERVPRFS